MQRSRRCNSGRPQRSLEARAQHALCKAVEANVSCTNPQLPASVEKLAASAATLIAKQMATADVSSLTAMVEQAGLTRDERQREELMEKIPQEADRIQDNGMSNVDTVTNQICTLICQALTLKRCFKCGSLEHASNSSACPKKCNTDNRARSRSPRRRNRSRDRNDQKIPVVGMRVGVRVCVREEGVRFC